MSREGGGLEALGKHWGFTAFRPLQREAVEAAIGGRDALLVLATGGGKSLCYQLPAVCGRSLVLVVSPLIALMDDQVAGAQQAGLRAAALHSNLDEGRRRHAFGAAARGDLEILYVSPERLAVGDLIDVLGPRLGLIAVDEAHCVSHWGHDFRPEYRQLAPLFDRAPAAARMALTATATPQVQEDICTQLGLRSPLRLIGHPDRPNLVYRAHPRAEGARQILEVVRRYPGQGGIVYALTRKDTERIAEALRKAGVDARPYHAGMDAAARAKVQDDFVNERLQVVAATIAFGMGIDRSNVRFVVHAHLPRSLEHYQQESGRAGRDGLPAECVLLASAGDLFRHKRMAQLDGPLTPARRVALDRQLADIGRFAVAPVCRHRILVEHFGFDLEQRPSGCSACDVCLGETSELPAAEALVVARKVISAAWRCGNSFGAAHVAEVLRGGDSDKVRRFGHEKLSVFGLLAGVPEGAVRSWIDQLVIQGYLEIRDKEGFPLLAMTEAGRTLCQEEGPVRLGRFEERPRAGKAKTSGKAARAAHEETLGAAGTVLFERLRVLRRLVAERLQVPPYVVFSDATLRDLVLVRPRDADQLLLVKGIGEHKRERYGAPFLALLAGEEPEAAARLLATTV
ncbi:MAG: RecQ family ATP-dependent DNA helicase [Candidatus Methylomirabilia bacterium]